MTIHLPENLKRSVLAEVLGGHFASVDDAIAEAVRLLLAQGRQPRAELDAEEPTTPPSKPIWEVFEEISAEIPDMEWAKLPVDGAEQHNHYIHGTPKRPAS